MYVLYGIHNYVVVRQTVHVQSLCGVFLGINNVEYNIYSQVLFICKDEPASCWHHGDSWKCQFDPLLHQDTPEFTNQVSTRKMSTLPMPIFNPSPSISSHSPTTRQVSLVLTIISDTSTLSDLAIHSISQELVWIGENLGIEFTISNVQRFGKWRRKTYTWYNVYSEGG